MSSFIFHCPRCNHPFMTDEPDDICEDCKAGLPGTFEIIQAEKRSRDADPDWNERTTYTKDELLNIKAGDGESVLGDYDLTSGAAYLFAQELVENWIGAIGDHERLEDLLGDVPLGIQQILDWWNRIRHRHGIEGGYGNNTRLARITEEAREAEEIASKIFHQDISDEEKDWEQYDHSTSYAQGLRRALAILEGRTNP